jgi:phosphotransferase system IIB component
MYLAREKLVSISAQKVDVEELKEKLKGEMEQQNRQLQLMVNSLVTENIDLKQRMSRTEQMLEQIQKSLKDLRES